MSSHIHYILLFYLSFYIIGSCPPGFSLCAKRNEICNELGVITFGEDTSEIYYAQKDASFTCNTSGLCEDLPSDANCDPIPYIDKQCCYQNPTIAQFPDINSITWIAGSLQCNQRIHAYIAHESVSQTLWKFTNPSQQSVTFGNCGSEISDTSLYLYDSTGKNLMSAHDPINCDGNNCGRDHCDTALKEVFTHPSMPIGVYYIRFASRSGSGEYKLYAECPNSPQPQYSDSNTLTCAKTHKNTYRSFTSNYERSIYTRIATNESWSFKFECDSITTWNTTVSLYHSALYDTGSHLQTIACTAKNKSRYSEELVAGYYYVLFASDTACSDELCHGYFTFSIKCSTLYTTELPARADIDSVTESISNNPKVGNDPNKENSEMSLLVILSIVALVLCVICCALCIIGLIKVSKIHMRDEVEGETDSEAGESDDNDDTRFSLNTNTTDTGADEVILEEVENRDRIQPKSIWEGPGFSLWRKITPKKEHIKLEMQENRERKQKKSSYDGPGFSLWRKVSTNKEHKKRALSKVNEGSKCVDCGCVDEGKILQDDGCFYCMDCLNKQKKKNNIVEPLKKPPASKRRKKKKWDGFMKCNMCQKVAKGTKYKKDGKFYCHKCFPNEDIDDKKAKQAEIKNDKTPEPPPRKVVKSQQKEAFEAQEENKCAGCGSTKKGKLFNVNGLSYCVQCRQYYDGNNEEDKKEEVNKIIPVKSKPIKAAKQAKKSVKMSGSSVKDKLKRFEKFSNQPNHEPVKRKVKVKNMDGYKKCSKCGSVRKAAMHERWKKLYCNDCWEDLQ